MQLSKQPLFVGVFAVFLIVLSFLFFTRDDHDLGAQSATTTPTENIEIPIATNTPEQTTRSTSTSETTQKPASVVTATKTPAPTKQTTPLTGKVASDIIRPTGFTNIEALGLLDTNQFDLKQFFGKKIILLEFWTTSSMNSARTFPYLNQWHAKYKDDGLLVVGVHTPQFTYEKSKTVVDQVIATNKIHFPVVIDNQYLTWNAYGNKFWPHRYVIDLNGRIVYEYTGDGAYEATEAKLAELLAARAKKFGEPFEYRSFEIPKDAFSTDVTKIGSPETFFGAARNQNLAGGVPLRVGVQSFERAADLKLNMIGLVGSWNFTSEYAQAMTENAAINYRYRAASVYATLSSESLIRVKVLRDGKPLDAANAGKEIRFEKGESVFYVKEARIYEIVNDANNYGEHTIELIPESGGLKAFVLMFG